MGCHGLPGQNPADRPQRYSCVSLKSCREIPGVKMGSHTLSLYSRALFWSRVRAPQDGNAWLQTHGHEYIGQWVAPDGAAALLTDQTLGFVLDQSRRHGDRVLDASSR